MKVKNIKDFIETHKLEGYIKNRMKEWDKNTYGKRVEGFIVKSSKIGNYRLTKTTPEYDFMYGADFKALFGDGHSCYCDLKITYKQDRLKDVETFLGSTLEFDACYDKREVIEVATGTYMCLGVKYRRTLYQGTMIYDKPVLVPIIFGNIEEDSVMNINTARNIKLLLTIGNQRLLEQGYDKTAKRSFSFIPNEVVQVQ